MFENLEALKLLLWPTRCAACDVLLDDPSKLICDRCHLAISPAAPVPAPPAPLTSAWALFYYEGAVSNLIARWKYHEDFAAQKALFSLIPERIEALKAFVPANACMIPVPPHPHRLRERGYDPVWSFASRLHRILVQHALEIPFVEDRLVRTRHTAHQAKLSREERLQKLDGACAVQGTLESPCILLIDDVYTTGSTSVACAQTLMASGAQRVDVLTLAQTVES